MKREAITLYTTKHKRLQYQHVFPCGVCPKLWDNQFPDYLTLSPFKLAIELVRKVMLVMRHNDLNILQMKARSIKLLWIGHAFELAWSIFKGNMRDRSDMVDMGCESILRINKDISKHNHQFTTLGLMVPLIVTGGSARDWFDETVRSGISGGRN